MRKPSKSAAPEDRVKLWLPSKDICRSHFRWETQRIGHGLSPIEVYIESRFWGHHCPRCPGHNLKGWAPWGSCRTSHGSSLDRDPRRYPESSPIAHPFSKLRDCGLCSLLEMCLVYQQGGRALRTLPVIPGRSDLQVGEAVACVQCPLGGPSVTAPMSLPWLLHDR